MGQLKENLGFIVIGVALILGAMLPLGNLVQREKFKSLVVPHLELPNELQKITDDKAQQYPMIEKNVLLGVTPELVAAKQKRQSQHGLRLRAIMIDGDARIANINGRQVHEGGNIRRHKVVSIQDSGVIVEGPSGRFTLTMR